MINCSIQVTIRQSKFGIKTRYVLQSIGKWFRETLRKIRSSLAVIFKSKNLRPESRDNKSINLFCVTIYSIIHCNYSFSAPPRLQALRNRDTGTGSSIRSYALQLAVDKTTTFSQNIDNFIQCTKEGKEASPHIVMRNMRQFMSGMKNYLVKHGEREFEKEVEKERLKLKPNEFLNLDAILEGVMMGLVVRPLREHVYRLFVDHYASTGSLHTLADSIQYAHGKHIQELGVRVRELTKNYPNRQRLRKVNLS